MTDDNVKGTEALYNLTKAAYDAEISRYDAAEAKAGRYLTVLGLIVGAFVVKFDDLLRVWNNPALPQSLVFLLALAYSATLICAIAALAFSVFAMSVHEVPAIPVGEEVETLFRDHPYTEALKMTTESFRTEARRLRDTSAPRIDRIQRASLFVKIVTAGAVITFLIYISLRALDAAPTHGDPKMSDTAKPSSTNTPQSTPTPATPAKPPTFETVKRGSGDVPHKK